MLKLKDSEAKMTAPKRTITVSDVFITGEGEKTQLRDEEGSIAARIAENLPEGVTEFDIKITIPLPVEEDNNDENIEEGEE